VDTAATFVFAGTVLSAQSERRSSRQLRVRADVVIQGRGPLADLVGETILVVDARELDVGGSYIFETVPLKYGESLEVRALDVKPASGPSNVARALASDPTLVRRVKTAALVVLGDVADVRPVGATPHVSEHAAAWYDALVRVERVYAGSSPGEAITIRFPESSDVQWHDAPRFHVGDRGVFLLRRDAPEGSTTTVFSALNPLDFVPADRSNEVEAILASG
jgi:hypothetical protein